MNEVMITLQKRSFYFVILRERDFSMGVISSSSRVWNSIESYFDYNFNGKNSNQLTYNVPVGSQRSIMFDRYHKWICSKCWTVINQCIVNSSNYIFFKYTIGRLIISHFLFVIWFDIVSETETEKKIHPTMKQQQE